MTRFMQLTWRACAVFRLVRGWFYKQPPRGNTGADEQGEHRHSSPPSLDSCSSRARQLGVQIKYRCRLVVVVGAVPRRVGVRFNACYAAVWTRVGMYFTWCGQEVLQMSHCISPEETTIRFKDRRG
ncbi:hypothetical protein VPH35_051624 [Triticum aestivum]